MHNKRNMNSYSLVTILEIRIPIYGPNSEAVCNSILHQFIAFN